jgi:hypothetical protein
MTKSLAAELELLANHMTLGKSGNQQLSIPALAERIAKNLKVKPDEVAILAFPKSKKPAISWCPKRCAMSAQFPSPARRHSRREPPAKAGRTFSTLSHGAPCDGVRRRESRFVERRSIQKIISAPICSRER